MRIITSQQSTRIAGAALVAWLCAAHPVRAFNDLAGDLITFNDNGAWSWFEDERAVVDVAAGKILVSSVADASGPGGASRNGDVDVVSYDLVSGTTTRFVLNAGLEADDHNSAALWIRPDGRYVASYSRHGSDNLTRYRVSTNPGDISSWSAEQTVNNGAGATYSNLHYLPADNGGAGRLYNFVRSVGFDPNVLVSNNWGTTFTYAGRLLNEGGNSDRPYLRYFSNGEEIHFIATERHPRNYDNSIYHGYVKNGQLFNSTGSLLDGNLFDGTAVAPAALTPVFATGTQFGGTTMLRAWTFDVAIDDGGLPYALFQARANDQNTDHRFFYGKFDGANWDVHEIARAGGFLYAAEDDYTGNGALDPSNPNRLFISTKIDPRTQATMARYEIFEGLTEDGGASWDWSPITYHSLVDNLRPIVPKWDDDHTALLWMRGTYTTYTNYNLSIVGLTEIGTLVESKLADFNGNGTVDADDYQTLLDGMHTSLAGLSFEQAYYKGDLNGDFASNFYDLLLFRDAYEADNGIGSFANINNQVPEPSGWAMAIVAVSVTPIWRVRSS